MRRWADSVATIERRLARGGASLCAAVLLLVGWGPMDSQAADERTPAVQSALAGVGRAATPAEVRAWDIDVRPDFQGLPAGKGSVADGEAIWEARCTSCHGVFGESNEVFTPIIGGTSAADIARGRVRNLEAGAGFAQRTTIMKASQVSTLWDYINRAMPWDKPKSLKTDEVYAVLAYMLNMAEIVPADFVLDERSIVGVQARMPNRDGMRRFDDLWRTAGRGDVQNEACMQDCPVSTEKLAVLPPNGRDTHGDLASQVRAFGPVRGIALTTTASTTAPATSGRPAAPASEAAATAAVADARPKAQAAGCLACHAVDRKLVGPALREIAGKHGGEADLPGYLARRIAQGGAGVWGPVPMPPQPQVSPDDVRALAAWIAAGAP